MAVVTTAAAACSGSANVSSSTSSSSSAPQYGGTLQIASLESDMDAIDPSQDYSIASWEIARAITRQLVTFVSSPTSLLDTTRVIPDLAQSWTVSPDGRTYTFHLKSDIHYSGSTTREIVAGDFVYAIKRFCDPNKQVAAINYFNLSIAGFPQYCKEFAADVAPGNETAARKFEDTHNISGVSAPNSTTLVLTSPAKNDDFLSILAMPFVTPLPEEVVGNYIPDSLAFRQHFPSSGPYYISSYEPGKEMTLTKVPNYNSASDPARKAYVNQIVVNFTTNTESAVVQAIQSGSADLPLYLQEPPVSTIASYEAQKSPYIHYSPGGGEQVIILNTQPSNKSPAAAALRKLQVREAIDYAIDKQALVTIQGGPLVAQPLNQILLPTILGYQPYDPYPTPGNAGDAAKAEQLLAAAGYPNGLKLNAVYQNDPADQEVATALQSEMAKANIKLNLIALPVSTFYGYTQNKNAVWDLNVSGIFGPDYQGDSDLQTLGGWLDSDGAPCGAGNIYAICYSNPQLNALAAQAFGASDPAPIWTQADELTSRDLPWIPMFSRNKVVITSSRVRNFEWDNLAIGPDITNISLAGG